MSIKESLYTVLDLVTLKKGIPVTVNGFRLRLPTRYHRYFSKSYEKENFDFFLKHCKKGMTTLDIGAHFGLFSIFFQKESKGTVYAFEPTRSTREVLQQTVAINYCGSKVKVVDMAVDEVPGTAQFFISEVVGGRANTLVKGSQLSHATLSYTVPVTSVDVFTKENNLEVNCIKIDAEGVELGVLKGARETIEKFKPFILLSLHPEPIHARGNSLKEIWDIIKGFRYTVLLSDTGNVMDENEFCSKIDLFDVHLVSSNL